MIIYITNVSSAVVGRYGKVAGYTTNYAISAYHH